MKPVARTAILAALTMGALGGCASTERYKAKLHTWIGHDEAALTQAWGTPDANEKLTSGNRLLVYPRPKRTPLSWDDAQAGTAPAQGLYLKCATYFEVDARDKIVNTSFEGEECSKIK